MDSGDVVLLIVALVVGAGLVVSIIMGSRVSARAALAAAEAAEAAHARNVADKKAALAELEKDDETNQAEIEALKADLAAQREALQRDAAAGGATADEIAERIRRLGL